jgi:biopolymer transport protein TolR
MLVLLVIFMVAAPMVQQGFTVQLPKSTQGQAIGEPVTVSIPATFKRDRTVRNGTEAEKLEYLDERIRQALSGQLQQNVIVAGDGTTTLQDLITVRDQLVLGGVKKIDIQTQPGQVGR